MYANLLRVYANLLRAVRRAPWWVAPVLSGVLLILTFHPFNLWPLGFVALAPLYWFAGARERLARQVFWGGFIAGGMFAFALSYFTLIQFHWLPQTYLFVDAVRAAVIPITLVGGLVCGTALLAYRALHGRSALLNALLAAAVYTLAEFLLELIFGGYYLATLAYAAVPLPPLLSIAAVGGTPLVSFCLAWVSGLIAEAPRAGRQWWRAAALSAAGFLIVFVPNYIYLHRPLPAQRSINIAVVQAGDRTEGIFGTEQNGVFAWPMESALSQAAASRPDLLIYPFSPVEGSLYRGVPPALNKDVLVASERAVGATLKQVVPASTTVLTWNNVYAGGKFYNEFELWQGGQVASQYLKRDLFPFMDYTPAWAARIGLYSTPFDEVAGPAQGQLVLNGQPLGDLMCSELHNTSLARSEADRAPLIIAVGSEAMFLDDVASEFALRAAQLRAAENDIPVVRGNILGPSGIIDRFGALEAMAPAGQPGSISAWVALAKPRPTLYNRLGDIPVLALIGAVFVAAWVCWRTQKAR